MNLMIRLRDPKHGCPWDVEQDFSTIAPYTIEEAYEVSDAIERGDLAGLKEELGDLLFQVVFHAQMASEEDAFDLADVIDELIDKMVRRHPHVFGEQQGIDSAAAQTANWEALKDEERRASADSRSALDRVPSALPALMRAEKLQKRAARVGFDWKSAEPVYEKVKEELGELTTAARTPDDAAKIEDEFGDLLFACVNLGRKLALDPEQALRRANSKFARRFKAMEAIAGERKKRFSELDAEALEELWEAAKSRSASARR